MELLSREEMYCSPVAHRFVVDRLEALRLCLDGVAVDLDLETLSR